MIRPDPGEWHPRMPERLDEEELADWRAGRNAVYQLAALTVGARLAVADAVAGNDAALEVRERQMEELERQGRYPSGPCVPAVSRAFATFERRDFSAAIDALEPIAGELERIGGSRAQLDLVEFTLLKAYLSADRLDDARRMLSVRRSGPSGIPVAGLAAVH